MKFLINGLLLVVSLVIVLVVFEGIFRFLPVRSIPHTAILDDAHPVPSFVPNEKGMWSRDWNFSIVNKLLTNNLGFPNPQDYIQGNKPVVAVIGDSFVEAAMTPYEKTFHGLLAEKIRPNFLVYTFAMSGAQLPNYLVWARFAIMRFAPPKMIFVIIPNDYDESLHTYKQSPGSYYFFQNKNRELYLDKVDFSISGSRSLVRSSALLSYVTQNLQTWEKIKELLYGYQQRGGNFNTSQWLKDARMAVDFFFAQLDQSLTMKHKDVLFVVSGSIENAYGEGKNDASARAKDEADSYFIATAKKLGYPVIPLQPIFKMYYEQYGKRFVYPTDMHWNELAHQIVCDAILSSGFLNN